MIGVAASKVVYVVRLAFALFFVCVGEVLVIVGEFIEPDPE